MAKAVPLSEFRVNSARILEGLSETRGFAYLTKNGYSVAVVADVEEFERMYGYAIDHGYKAGRDEDVYKRQEECSLRSVAGPT